jgi:hypothetical protein
MTIFHARDIAPEQAGTLLDITLGEFLVFAEHAKAVADNHGGIIPSKVCPMQLVLPSHNWPIGPKSWLVGLPDNGIWADFHLDGNRVSEEVNKPPPI